MSEAQELKACPFCGGRALECKSSEGREMYWVLCRSCHCGPYERRTPEEAITAWNTRPREAELEALLSELVAVVRGECPRLLSEDSGGYGDLAVRIEAALSHPKGSDE